MVEVAAPSRGNVRDWPFEVTPLHSALGGEILGITLAQALDAALFDKVYEAFLAYELILFRNVDLAPAMQVAFARRFGEVQIHVMNQYHGAELPEIYRLSTWMLKAGPTASIPIRARCTGTLMGPGASGRGSRP